MVRRVSQPPIELLFADASSMAEFGAFLMSLPELSWSPREQGQPALVMPPFTTDDNVPQPLRRFLNAHGFAAHGWQLDRNQLRTQRRAYLHERHGEPVSLVSSSGRDLGASARTRISVDGAPSHHDGHTSDKIAPRTVAKRGGSRRCIVRERWTEVCTLVAVQYYLS